MEPLDAAPVVDRQSASIEPHRRELSRQLRIAVASAHAASAAGMSLNELVAYVLEHGLPSRGERERIQLERDARERGEPDTPFLLP